MSSRMDRLHENKELNLKNNIIKLIDDGNNNHRQNVSIYDLLIELGIHPMAIPKNETELMFLTFSQSFTIKYFSVKINFNSIGGHLCGYVTQYIGDKKNWIDMDKYESITNNDKEFILENNKNIYIPHGGFTHHNGFDCHHTFSGDIGLIDDIMNEKMGMNSSLFDFRSNDNSFKSAGYVICELTKIVDSLIEYLKK